MSKFESIHIQGFRRLVDVKLELRPLMVMIGANGCGKTSLLEAWRVLAKSAEGKLSDTISSLGGISELLTRTRTSDKTESTRLVFGLQLIDPAQDYHLEISDFGFGYGITGERLNEEPLNGGSLDETVLSDSKSDDVRQLRRVISSTFFARPFDLAQVRRPHSMQPSRLPGEQGEALVSCLYSLRETDRDRYEVVEDTLRAAFPDFERLEFPPVAAGMLVMAWKDRQFTQPIYMNQFSEGTLRFLWLTALLLSRDLPAVTLIDEPEVSLHPQLLMLLVDLMREASMRTQLIVATQSDRLIRFLKPEEVLVADVEEGAAKFTWGDDLDLDHWLKDFTLDQLWTMGVLGGRS